MMQIETIQVGPLEVNCHLVREFRTGVCLIIDPGDDSERIRERILEFNGRPAAILLTHGHVDHIRGVGILAETFSCPVWLHSADHPLYHSPANAVLPWLPAATDLPPLQTGPPPQPGKLSFKTLHTPGHSPGSCCFHFPDQAILFCGDTLFAGSIGRTDLPGGNHQTLLASIQQTILRLPPATRLYSGHGPPTTIGEELENNPFLVNGSSNSW